MYEQYGWNTAIRFDPKEIATWRQAKPGDKIFVGSMIDLFHPVIDRRWLAEIMAFVSVMPKQIFIFLTKQARELSAFNPWPTNCWVGVTATNGKDFAKACFELRQVQSSVKFLSVEPLIGPIYPTKLASIILQRAGINWLIAGAMTGARKRLEVLSPWYPDLQLEVFHHKWSLQPPRAWKEGIIALADYNAIPLFIKDNFKWSADRRQWP